MTSNMPYRKTLPPFQSRNVRQTNGNHKQPQEDEWMNLMKYVSLAARKRQEIAEKKRLEEEQRMPKEDVEEAPTAQSLIEEAQEFLWKSMGEMKAKLRKKRFKEGQGWEKPQSLSREEVEEEVWEMVDMMAFEYGMGQGPQESFRAWDARMQLLNERVHEIWAENSERMLMREPRYVEGLPARLMLWPPTFMPHKRRGRTGLDRCLQCEVKGLQCSRVRSGEKCLVKMKGGTEWMVAGRKVKEKIEKKKPGQVRFAEEEESESKSESTPEKSEKGMVKERKEEEDEEEEVRKLVEELEDRRKGVRSEVVGDGMQRIGGLAVPMWSNAEALQYSLYVRNMTVSSLTNNLPINTISPAPNMPPPPDLSSYRLSDEQSTRIFTQEILPAEFPPSLSSSSSQSTTSDPPSRTPLAILAVGQTGAGKTRLAPAILSTLQSQDSNKPTSLAHFIADTYKTYHPEYTRLMLSTPNLASPATGPDARRWLSMAAQEAVRRNLDVLLESACRHPDDFTQLASIFRSANYRVEVLILAVPEALSRLGILTRFYEKLPEAQSRNLPIRLTPVKVHDDSYKGLLDAATFLDQSGAADQVLVIRRGNLVAYSEEKGSDGKWKGGIADAIQRERERPLTNEEMKLALDDIQKVSTHEDATDQVGQVRTLLQPLINQSSERHDEFPELRPLEFGSLTTKDDKKTNILRLGYV
ncbi:hypothetical protein PT974_10678 [Cladobotryum mycophilum]|uniref:Zeta toxin domain-containing protein n=1 Tax=Cladobotryum mycophilum TaxID=491253 RepID=A0ABR0SAJ8_9HYPO